LWYDGEGRRYHRSGVRALALPRADSRRLPRWGDLVDPDHYRAPWLCPVGTISWADRNRRSDQGLSRTPFDDLVFRRRAHRRAPSGGVGSRCGASDTGGQGPDQARRDLAAAASPYYASAVLARGW